MVRPISLFPGRNQTYPMIPRSRPFGNEIESSLSHEAPLIFLFNAEDEKAAREGVELSLN